MHAAGTSTCSMVKTKNLLKNNGWGKMLKSLLFLDLNIFFIAERIN
jgi:hypothetical protein